MTDLQSRSEVSWRNGMMSEPHEAIVRAYASGELMTRAEWEATIDYEAGQAASNGGLTSLGYIKLIVDAALHIEEDS